MKPLAHLIVVNPSPGFKAIRTLKLPKLIAHSKEDQVAPFSMGEKYYNNAPETKELWKIVGKQGQLLDYQQKLIDKIESLLHPQSHKH